MQNSHRLVGILFVIGAFLTLCEPAAAYIDAGSGSYLLQILFAGLFGAAYTVKMTWRNLRSMVLRRSQSVSATADPDSSNRPGA